MLPHHILLLLLLLLLLSPLIESFPHIAHGSKDPIVYPTSQTGTVAIDWDDEGGSKSLTCQKGSYHWVPDYCTVLVTFKSPFSPSVPAPVVFATIRTRAATSYPVMSVTVLNTTMHGFTALVYTQSQSSDEEDVNLVLDYYTYSPSDFSSSVYGSQFGTLDIPDRLVASSVPGTVSKKFDAEFEETPAVFGQVRYNGDAPSGTYISPFTITVTECTKDHVKFSVACLGSVYVSSEQDDDEVKSVGLATPPNDERKLPVLPTSTGIYDCLWNSDYSIDWRAWAIDPNENNTQCDDIAIYHPQSVFKVDADTSAPTYAPKTTSPTPSPTVVPPPSSEKPFHAITKLSTTTTRASVTQIMFASYGTCLKIEVPPGMIGMVYIDSVENTQDYLQVFGLSLGINPGDTSQSFFADVYSANGEDISPKLSLAWFAWNGTGTNCPKDKDGVVCGGHGVCPDGGDEDNTIDCDCDGYYNGTGCETCLANYAGPNCEACDGAKPILNANGTMIGMEFCSGHGTCNGGITGDGTCTCDPGGYATDPELDGNEACGQCALPYYGHPFKYNQTCELCPYSGGAEGEVCNGHTAGACTVVDGKDECVCIPPFDGISCDGCVSGKSGPDCELTCEDDCNDHGICSYRNETDGHGDDTSHIVPYCQCQEGFDAATNCGSCIVGEGRSGDYCCLPGYTGQGCDECAEGYLEVVDAVDPDLTVCHACNPNSAPNEISDPDDVKCACASGYTMEATGNPQFPQCTRDNFYELGAIAFAVVFVLGATMGYWFYRKSRMRKKLEMHKLDVLSERLLAKNPQLEGMEQAFRTMSSDAADWLIQFEDIELGTVVGSGTSAYVFRGWYADQAVAVKRLHSIRWEAKEFEAFFTQEAGLIARLHHPNVVRFYGVCYQDDHFYLVTEFCEENLSQALKRFKDETAGGRCTTVPEEFVVKLSYQIAKGMTYLHSKDVVHRDLKPENILLDEKGDVKLCDFGLSRLTTKDEEMTQQVGTPAYMAPEMAGIDENAGEEASRIGKPVDVYSYGILLWTLWTQKLPYSELRVKNPFQLMVKVTNGFRPSLPDDMPDYLRNLMQRCWVADPGKRPVFGDILKELKAELNRNGLFRSGGMATGMGGSFHFGSSGKEDAGRPPRGPTSPLTAGRGTEIVVGEGAGGGAVGGGKQGKGVGNSPFSYSPNFGGLAAREKKPREAGGGVGGSGGTPPFKLGNMADVEEGLEGGARVLFDRKGGDEKKTITDV